MPIIHSKLNMVHFAILGAAGGGGGRVTSNYQHTDHTLGNGGCGSLVTATYYITRGTTLYYFIGKGGQGGRSTATAASHTTYGGDGAGDATTGDNDTGAEGGEFSGIFTANGVSNTNALVIAGGGGGAAGRPHGAHNAVDNRCNGGGGISSATDGHGNDGTQGNQTPTLSGTSDGSAEGGQKNAGGRAGTASGTSRNQGGAGSNWYGGAGSRTSHWGNGGGGGAGLYGGGGGADDGDSWGGQGGGAGSSYIRGYITDYTDSNLNSQNHELAKGYFWTQAHGHTGGTAANGHTALNMRNPEVAIEAHTGNLSSPTTTYGYGGQHTETYAGVGTDGKQGIICYKVDFGVRGEGSWIQLTSPINALTAFTI